ncbi:MAG: 3-deoxy-D-manno-octulosonic acid transferase [Pyrinomonadaceae bacterium]
MYFVYSLLLTLGFLILLPRFLFDAFHHGKYVAGFRQRLGSIPPIKNDGRPVVWLHCVSVGESQAARPLVEGIRKRFPDHLLVVSTITLTGQNLAREVFKDKAASIFYFPFDWRWTVRRALKAIRPSAVLIMETELWPGFLRECRIQQIPVAIVNGRLSHQSYRRYKWIRGFVSRVLRGVSLAAMQTEADAERISRLGLDRGKVFVSGNLKFEAGKLSDPNSQAADFRRRFNIRSEEALILAASTHAPEESAVLGAFQFLRERSSQKSRLILAPRHPERFADVASLIEKSGLAWTSRTRPAQSTDGHCEVILLDTIGELKSVYALASIVFVGGSIANTGGHNILEPAATGAAIVTGAHTHNFEAIVEAFVNDDALIQLPPLSGTEAKVELGRVFAELLEDQQRRYELGRRARKLVERNSGAAERTLHLLDSILTSQKAH